MAVAFVQQKVSTRCISKNMYPGAAGGQDTVGAQLTGTQDPYTGFTLSMTYPLDSDMYQLGSYYDVTIDAGTPPPPPPPAKQAGEQKK